MQTRRAAKKQRIETGPLLGPVHLPAEVIGNNLLRCLDLPSLLRLSTCNSAVKGEVFRKQIGEGENASIWQVIDFGKVSKEMASKLTDDQLKKLLVKCHAKEVTTILKLTGCVGLKGKGLEPLRGSIVLREADLRFSLRTGLESTYVLNLLSSMPPIAPVPASFGNRHLGLALVKFPIVRHSDADNFYDRFRDETKNWLLKFHLARRESLTRHRTRCDHCQEDICDKRTDEDLGLTACIGYCETCKKASCHGSEIDSKSECASIRHCRFCMLQCCFLDEKCTTEGNYLFICDECGLAACDGCINWQFRDVCFTTRCGRSANCETDGAFCIYCIAATCEDCLDGPTVSGKDGVLRNLCKECKEQGKPFDKNAIKYL